MEHFGFNEKTNGLTWNWTAEIREEDNDDEELGGGEATTFRAIAAMVNSLAQDYPDLHFPPKEVYHGTSRRSWRGTWCKGKQ